MLSFDVMCFILKRIILRSDTCQASWPNGKALLSGNRVVAEIAGSNPVGVAFFFSFFFFFFIFCPSISYYNRERELSSGVE